MRRKKKRNLKAVFASIIVYRVSRFNALKLNSTREFQAMKLAPQTGIFLWRQRTLPSYKTTRLLQQIKRLMIEINLLAQKQYRQ